MFLKSLDIFGFKSFADKTHIEFSEGITALVGPNGCGKSNVVDAVKWVLAENRAKNLRADTMESVIFNGTESRPALNIAEVMLTISNEQKILPIDESEIALKRRLYRSGENEYFINNKQVGAVEVRRLFMDTGVGKAAYSVMEQGKIDQILSTKPEDRRYIFEEAAGISRSKAEVAEAERELERTRQNLEKIEAALTENKRTYDALKIQSERTSRYRELKETIFSAELDIQLLRLKERLFAKENGARLKKESNEKKIAVQKKIDSILESMSENNGAIRSLQEKMGELQREVVRIQEEKTGKTILSKKLSEDALSSKEKIAQLEIHGKTIEERLESLEDEIDSEAADFYAKTKNLQSVRENIKSFEKNVEQSQTKIAENKIEDEKSEKIAADLENEIAVLQKKLDSIAETIAQDLDAKLKGSFSAAKSDAAKQNLTKAISKIAILAKSRLALFQSYQHLEHSAADAAKFLREAADSLENVISLSEKAKIAADEFASTIPNFLDDFLSKDGILTRKRKIDSEIEFKSGKIKTLKDEAEKRKIENESLAGKIEKFKETLSTLRINEAQMAAQIDSSKKQSEMLQRQLAQAKAENARNRDEIFLEKKRFAELSEQIAELAETLAEIELRGAACMEKIVSLGEEITSRNESLSGKQIELKKFQDDLSSLQARTERLSIDLERLESDIRNIRQNFIESHSRDLLEFEERMNSICEDSSALKETLFKAKEEQKSLGQVNFMAVEEFAEAKARYEKIKSNYDDTKKSMEDLIRVSGEIRAKSAQMFLETYGKIRKNFHNMFRRLFGGGAARLKLTDSENVLTSGIDILAQPPGKKLENIALLSGGEKTMTAVALLFATYQVRPSPFCLLDEIDAALDDKNVASFVSALRSFSELSQYIVITHNKKTVLGAKTMLGVTMEDSGVSKLISMRVDRKIQDENADDNTERLPDSLEFEDEEIEDEEGIKTIPRPPKRIPK